MASLKPTLQAGLQEKGTTVSRGQQAEKKRATNVEPGKYFLKNKCREAGEGEISSDAEDGTITFDEGLVRFEGEADLYFVGSEVESSAFKISDKPSSDGREREDFSAEQHEAECEARWSHWFDTPG
ncbi:uncharacterized protein N7511_008670 [Penicillium nucicola]|uniref:uncharacterized protein n=1 Tax=Penicillium nucicola TaxID=1850975 RepID=UPI0025450E6B|nr:uncharacterized protein N7511_008670 [Penicillium nucicola]KAJ5746974.1 hypothetical protein N7511_008670 [Penicillium nucicola]